MSWVDQSSDTEPWVRRESGESVWDGGSSLWDEGVGGILRSIWDAGVNVVSWAVRNEASDNWTEV